MRWLRARWNGRFAGGAALAAVGWVAAVWLDFEPRPLPYAVWAVVVLTTTFLVIDTVDTAPSTWQHDLPAPRDREDEATSDLRVLTSHQQADHPSEALARRLVALARDRDPALAAEIQRGLAGVHRIPPADIDRILTRIEDVRDRP